MSEWKIITGAPTRVPVLLKFPTPGDKGMTIGFWDGEAWRSFYDNSYLDQPILYADVIPREPSHAEVMRIIRPEQWPSDQTDLEDAIAKAAVNG